MMPPPANAMTDGTMPPPRNRIPPRGQERPIVPPETMMAAQHNDHGERLARLEAQGEALQANVATVCADVHGILARFDNLTVLVTRAVEALHTPMSCPNAGRITSNEHRIGAVEKKQERASGGGAVLYWLVGVLVAVGLVLLGKAIR